MFIELIDLLRCPVEHEDSWLVAAFTRMDGRFVIEGKLGCPVCSASYPITDGVADFSAGHVTPPQEVALACGDPFRLPAMLGLTRPGTTIVMQGRESMFAETMTAMTESRVIAVNPETQIGEYEQVGVVLSRARFPLAPGSADGVVITDADDWMAEAARVTKPGGRIVAPASARFDARFRELARDDENVVAESIGPLVTLSR